MNGGLKTAQPIRTDTEEMCSFFTAVAANRMRAYKERLHPWNENNVTVKKEYQDNWLSHLNVMPKNESTLSGPTKNVRFKLCNQKKAKNLVPAVVWTLGMAESILSLAFRVRTRVHIHYLHKYGKRKPSVTTQRWLYVDLLHVSALWPSSGIHILCKYTPKTIKILLVWP